MNGIDARCELSHYDSPDNEVRIDMPTIRVTTPEIGWILDEKADVAAKPTAALNELAQEAGKRDIRRFISAHTEASAEARGVAGMNAVGHAFNPPVITERAPETIRRRRRRGPSTSDPSSMRAFSPSRTAQGVVSCHSN